MDATSKERALEILDTHAEALTPFYDDLHERLQSSAAASHLLGKQAELAHRQANEELVRNIISLLPGRSGTWSVAPQAATISEAKILRENIVHIAGRSSSEDPGEFCFIAGSRDDTHEQSKGTAATQLLLYPMRTLAPKVVKVLNEDMDARDEKVRQDLAREHSEQEIDYMFSPGMGLGTIAVQSYTSWNAKARMLLIESIVPRRRRYHEGQIRRTTRWARGSSVYLGSGMSDQDLATFGVLRRLNELSVAFGVKEQARQIMHDYSVRPDTDEVVL